MDESLDINPETLYYSNHSDQHNGKIYHLWSSFNNYLANTRVVYRMMIKIVLTFVQIAVFLLLKNQLPTNLPY